MGLCRLWLGARQYHHNFVESWQRVYAGVPSAANHHKPYMTISISIREKIFKNEQHKKNAMNSIRKKGMVLLAQQSGFVRLIGEWAEWNFTPSPPGAPDGWGVLSHVKNGAFYVFVFLCCCVLYVFAPHFIMLFFSVIFGEIQLQFDGIRVPVCDSSSSAWSSIPSVATQSHVTEGCVELWRPHRFFLGAYYCLMFGPKRQNIMIWRQRFERSRVCTVIYVFFELLIVLMNSSHYQYKGHFLIK